MSLSALRARLSGARRVGCSSKQLELRYFENLDHYSNGLVTLFQPIRHWEGAKDSLPRPQGSVVGGDGKRKALEGPPTCLR